MKCFTKASQHDAAEVAKTALALTVVLTVVYTYYALTLQVLYHDAEVAITRLNHYLKGDCTDDTAHYRD